MYKAITKSTKLAKSPLNIKPLITKYKIKLINTLPATKSNVYSKITIAAKISKKPITFNKNIFKQK